MNLAYFRNSTFDQATTLANAQTKAAALGLTVLGTSELPNNQGVVLNICHPEWMSNLLSIDANLVGFLPCSLVILNKNDKVMVGVSNPSLLGSVSHHPEVTKIAAEAETKLKQLVHDIAGVGPLTVKRVKLYSTTTCPYCKMEASWLDSHKINYEQVHVDLNQAAAEEMVNKTGQMGVPVTAIEYDDGIEEFIVGFDKNRLSQILNIN